MKLSELIKEYGDDRAQIQNLDECTDKLSMSNGITKITFGTETPVDFNGTVKMGLVVWLDREEVARIIAASKSKEQSNDNG